MSFSLIRSRVAGLAAVTAAAVAVVPVLAAPAQAGTAESVISISNCKIKQERKLAGTLPEWQEMPLTWLAIAGLVCTIIGFLLMFFTQSHGVGGLLPV